MMFKKYYSRLSSKIKDYLIWILILILFIIIFPFNDFLIRFLFALGIMFQAYLYIGRDFDPYKFNRILVATLLASFFGFGFLGDPSQDNGFIENFGFLFFLFFPLIFSFTYREYILNRVYTSTIISYTLLFFFFLSTGRYQGLYFPYTIEVPLALLSIYGLYIILVIKTPSANHLKALMFWFLLSLISLTTLEFLYHRPDTSSFLLDNHSYVNNFFSGMVYMYVACHVWYLKSVFSRKAKSVGKDSYETKTERSETKHYPINYSSRSVIIMVILIQCLMLLSNQRYHFVSDFFMISLWIVIIPQISTMVARFKKNGIISQQETRNQTMA